MSDRLWQQTPETLGISSPGLQITEHPKTGSVCQPASGRTPRRDAISSDAFGSCFRADYVLIESEQSMACEDRDGSAVEKDVGFEIDKELMGRFLAGGIYERDLFERLDMALSFIYPFE